jgi:hypothetical protein
MRNSEKYRRARKKDGGERKRRIGGGGGGLILEGKANGGKEGRMEEKK